MAIGAIIAHFWQKKNLHNYDIYCFAIAAGFSAGEGLGGCLNALLSILKVDGSYYGTAAGCPESVLRSLYVFFLQVRPDLLVFSAMSTAVKQDRSKRSYVVQKVCIV